MLGLLVVLPLGLMGIHGGCLIGWSVMAIGPFFFSTFRVTHLDHTASGHSPLLLSCDKDVANGPSRFKFLHA